LKDVYYITGTDGSGKTTFLKEIEYILSRKEIKTNHIWIRSPKILSKPLMVYCRLVGLTRYTTIDGITYGKHEFYKSRFVSWLFPKLQLVDFRIKWYLTKCKIRQDQTVLFDRFNIDTLADLMVDTRNLELHKSDLGKKFLKLTPSNTKIIVLYVEESIVRNRKRDTLYDEQLSYKIAVYKKLGIDLNLKLIDNSHDFDLAKKEILSFLEL